MKHLVHLLVFPWAILSILGAGVWVGRHNNCDYATGYTGATVSRIGSLMMFMIVIFGIAATVFAVTNP